MSRKLKYLIGMLLFVTTILSCDKWNESKPLPSLDRIDKSDEYYANLRAYKKSEHELTFGWFAEWSVDNPSSGTALRGVPDSVDIIAIWSGGNPVSPEKKEDLRYVQQVKGTKVLFTVFLHFIGEGLSNDQKSKLPTNKEEAIVQWANQLIDTMKLYQYDGIDFDFEPDHCGCAAEMANEEYFDLFVKTMSKHIGPKSSTGKIFMIDGLILGTKTNIALQGMGEYFDYFLEQSYAMFAGNSYTGLDRRFNEAIKFFPANKILMNLNFQNNEYKDVNAFTLKDGSRWDRYLGYAKWQPSNGMRKGGIGGYHMQIDFSNGPEYKYVRQGIQIMNPAVK